jgi:hypothetical protein
MITDYILKFPSKAVAEQFGIASGYALDNEGVIETTLATHEYALHVIGEHFIPQPDIDDEPQPAIGDGQYWVLFRDLVGIPSPEGADQFIFWASTSDTPRPPDDPTVPNDFWA